MPMPAFNDQFLYFYFGLAKEKLSAHVIVLFCGNEEGCWGHIAQPGYSFYAEVSQSEGVGYKQFAGGEKIGIGAGDTAQVTIIQSDEYLSLNVTKLSGDSSEGSKADSYFDIYGANDGGLSDIIAGVILQYDDTGKQVSCGDYNAMPLVITDILAVESDGTFIQNIDFKQDANNSNTCNGVIDVGAYGRTLDIYGSKSD